MNIQTHIENLREKPEHVKKQIAFWSAFGITLIIFTFWVASFTSVGKSTQQAVAQAVEQAGTPAQSLTASVGGFFSDIKDLIFKPRVVTYTDIEVAPGK
ncbi:MAG TPA: hypothetical protein VL335_01155 [Candidatus Paceibacterota bacterium]|jgi:hypothetical protein|nr:hypothetical protein [Candidatus Paceibacterota bacterium]